MLKFFDNKLKIINFQILMLEPSEFFLELERPKVAAKDSRASAKVGRDTVSKVKAGTSSRRVVVGATGVIDSITERCVIFNHFSYNDGD
jgi:hypothetical protein